ncbi:MAG TPA: YcnI family protein [Ilumatobacter sp.]|nr:YcnI family protein [Ilumatobacter sp.]
MSVLSRARYLGLATLAGVALAVAPAVTASAHVSVSSSDVAPGGTGTLVFRVPTESDTAGTVALSVALPADTPFRSVRAAYLPGWTVTLESSLLPEPVEVGGFTLTEAVTRVTWTADAATVAAGGVGPDQYALFQMRVGPFPDGEGTYAFPATQTYSDGEVVAWADPVVDGEPEPAHPAPTLTVTADGASGGGHGDSHGAAGGGDAGDTAESATSGGSDTTARVLGVAGIVLGASGLAGGALLGRRRNPAASTAIEPS